MAADTGPHIAPPLDRRRLTAEHVAARALLTATTIDEAVPRILEAICEALGWEHGAFWTVDRAAGVLRCADIWTTATARFTEFDAVSRRLTFTKGVGLPGRVWATAEPAWIPDVTKDANFPRAPVAAREGLHAAFGFPVLLRGEVQSVLEFFSREIRQPDDDLLSMLAAVGNQIGMFIERRRAEEELDRFFTLSLDMMCVAGYDGTFKRLNPAWQRILGYRAAELVGTPYMDLVHPDDKDATVRAAASLSEGREVVYFENRFRHRDGTWRWLLWTSSPFPDQQVVYAAARDITERKEAEDTLADYARDLERTRSALEEQAARLANLVKELEVARRTVAVEVERAAVGLSAARDVALQYQQTILPRTQELLRATRSGFETGLTSFLEVLEAQRVARQTQVEYVNAIFEAVLAHTNLERAVGDLPGLELLPEAQP